MTKPSHALKHASTQKQPNFQPVFTDEQVYKLEADYNETYGVGRRLTMIALARSSASLLKGFGATNDNGDTLIAMIEQIAEYHKHLESGIKLSECALARLFSVGRFISEGETA